MPIRKLIKSTGGPSGPSSSVKKPKFTLEGTELGNVMSQIQGAYGEEVSRVLSKMPRYEDRVRTSIFALDLSLAGGWLTSRGSMLYGEKSSGKSTTAMLSAIEAQRMYPDQAVAWIDIEGTFDEAWFAKLGGDPERLVLTEPETGEHAIDIAHAFSQSREVSVLVTDSIAMLTPMKEIEGSAEDQLPGIHARLIGNYLRRINNAMLKERHRKHRILVLHINQFRMKIGIAFGDPRTLPGGKALEFCTTQQVEMRNKEILNDAGDVVHNEHNFKITKDKTGGRIREGKFHLVRTPEANRNMPEGSILQTKTILGAGERIGLVEGRYEIKGFGKRPSADAWTDFFLKEPEAYARVQHNIIAEFRKRWGLPVAD